MVNARLVYQLEKNKCIPLFQSGFRKGRSTLDNIIQLESKIRNAFVRRNHLVSIFFDIEKAYDRTWRYGILRTLFNFGFRGNLPTFIKKFLNLRTFRASLYVDDLQISCEGSTCSLIERQLQTAVNNIVNCKSTVAPVVFQRVFAYHRSQYSRYSAIYTDGSKRADYVGCGVVIEDIMHGYRLDTSCSIFTAEAVAIYRALHTNRLHYAP
ncbi:putative RNA-directed DNA polymerase from transposon X-element [Trichonephila clavipes]|nr:putative RNA-directed DNA polymerase from transposon X-element [Trichonephila clavipes]